MLSVFGQQGENIKCKKEYVDHDKVMLELTVGDLMNYTIQLYI